MNARAAQVAHLLGNSTQCRYTRAERRIRHALRGVPDDLVAQAQAEAARRIRGGQCWTLAANIEIKRARRLAQEHSRSQTGLVFTHPNAWTQGSAPRPPARGSGIAGVPTAHEHRVVPCAHSPYPSAQGNNSPESPPPDSMQAAHFLAMAPSP